MAPLKIGVSYLTIDYMTPMTLTWPHRACYTWWWFIVSILFNYSKN